MLWLVCAALIYAPHYADAYVSRVVFITPPQSIVQGAVSKPITLQIQDESSQKAKSGETIDLTLSSNSKTGEFSSNGGAWKSDTTLVVNSSFTGRTFYYKDIIPGDYVLTARMKGRTSGLEWIALQEVRIEAKSASDQSPGSVVSISVSQKATPKAPAPKTPVQKSKKDNQASPSAAIETVPLDTIETKGFFSKIWSFIVRLFF